MKEETNNGIVENAVCSKGENHCLSQKRRFQRRCRLKSADGWNGYYLCRKAAVLLGFDGIHIISSANNLGTTSDVT